LKIEALERLLISTLRTELTTVKGYVGQTSEWIYVDYPRLDAKMPRISLTLISSMQRPASVGGDFDLGGGTLAVYEESLFEIDVWVHRTNKMTSPIKRAGTALRDYLGDEIVDVLLKQRKVLAQSNSGLIDIEKTGESNQAYDEDREIFRKTIVVRVTHRRDF